MTSIALLRGINVGGATRIPMAELRDLCAELGWERVQTYIQSGNVVFHSTSSPRAAERALEEALERRFGRPTAVMVRRAREWSALARGNAFPDESAVEPNRVMLALSKAAPKEDAAIALRERATAGERIARVGDALWLHFPAGAGTSKLSPAVLDRLVGSPVTMRNWRTVLELEKLAQITPR